MIKQVTTKIEFRKFNEKFAALEKQFYYATIRYLTLMHYLFFEIEKPDGYYICCTTGMYCLSKESGLFSKVKEPIPPKPFDPESLTYFEPNLSAKKRALGIKSKRRIVIDEVTGKVIPYISDEVVRAIRKNTTDTYKCLAERYGVAKSTVHNIKHRKIYEYVED